MHLTYDIEVYFFFVLIQVMCQAPRHVTWTPPCAKKTKKTYDSGDSPVVTHLTTNPPVNCLSMDDQTGIPAASVLWSYVKELGIENFMIVGLKHRTTDLDAENQDLLMDSMVFFLPIITRWGYE